MLSLPKNPKEGDNINCPDCGESIVARLKTYKDNQYPAYVQWQNKKETVSHKTKDGNCKKLTPDQAENEASNTKFKDDESQEVHTQETTVTSSTSHAASKSSVDGTDTSTTFTGTTDETSETPNLPEMDKIIAGYVDLQITLIRQIEARVFTILGADANVAKVGMYVKLILEGINKK